MWWNIYIWICFKWMDNFVHSITYLSFYTPKDFEPNVNYHFFLQRKYVLFLVSLPSAYSEKCQRAMCDVLWDRNNTDPNAASMSTHWCSIWPFISHWIVDLNLEMRNLPFIKCIHFCLNENSILIRNIHTDERFDSPSYPPIAHNLPIFAQRATRLRFTFIGATKCHLSSVGSYSSTLEWTKIEVQKSILKQIERIGEKRS